jgi:hypothetical protein
MAAIAGSDARVVEMWSGWRSVCAPVARIVIPSTTYSQYLDLGIDDHLLR